MIITFYPFYQPMSHAIPQRNICFYIYSIVQWIGCLWPLTLCPQKKTDVHIMHSSCTSNKCCDFVIYQSQTKMTYMHVRRRQDMSSLCIESTWKNHGMRRRTTAFPYFAYSFYYTSYTTLWFQKFVIINREIVVLITRSMYFRSNYIID